jgi:hypothetical protein
MRVLASFALIILGVGLLLFGAANLLDALTNREPAAASAALVKAFFCLPVAAGCLIVGVKEARRPRP